MLPETGGVERQKNNGPHGCKLLGNNQQPHEYRGEFHTCPLDRQLSHFFDLQYVPQPIEIGPCRSARASLTPLFSMEPLQQQNIAVLLLSLATLLGAAKVLGELAHRLRQPAVLGELLAGILLGPTVFGTIAPKANAFLFPQEGPSAFALTTITRCCR